MKIFCKKNPKNILGLSFHNYLPIDVSLMHPERHVYSVLMRCSFCGHETIKSGYEISDLISLGYSSKQILYFNARYGRKRLPLQREKPDNSGP